MKKIIAFIFSLLLFISVFSINTFGLSTASWYCVRNKSHNQPILSKELSIVDNYDVYWIDKRHSSMNDENKVIYITFDAGYENGNIEKILDVLREENVKATFFVLDNLLLKNKDLVKTMISDGHLIANHTLKHRDMSKMNSKEAFSKELTALEDLFYKEYGREMPKIYRPPEGRFNEDNLKWARELGYKTVMWSFAYADWDNERQASKSEAMKKILDNIHNGEVMLLHPTSSTNAEIMKDLIKSLKEQGFRFGTVNELCNS